MRFPRLSLMLVGIGLLMTGLGCSFTKSYEEREQTWAKITDNELRQLVSDVDLLLLMDEPMHLSRWQTR